ncbi:hypothetical protein D9M68_761160 [compost metagenome]
MCLHIKPLTEISVDRCQVHPVIKREQYCCYDKIPDEETEHHHIVLKAAIGIHARSHFAHRTGHRNKGNTTQAGTDHTEGNQHPVTVTVTDEKGFVVRIA